MGLKGLHEKDNLKKQIRADIEKKYQDKINKGEIIIKDKKEIDADNHQKTVAELAEKHRLIK